jgi:predicted nucleic acid-binding protein
VRNTVLTDTGFWLALISKKDRYHSRVLQYMQNASSALVTTWPVIVETSYLLNKRVGVHQQLEFVRSMSLGQVQIMSLQENVLSRAHVLMEKYRDLPMDLADASLVIAAEELNNGSILSTDRRDFQTYRWKNREPFHNLLFPDD